MEDNIKNRIFFDTVVIENAVNSDNRLDIEGYACHFLQENLNREVVDASSFDDFFGLYNSGKLKPRLNYNHSDTLVGGIDGLEVRERGLYMRAHLNTDIAIVRDMIAPCVLAGDINGFSTEGFVTNGYDDIVTHKDGSYFVKSFMLTGVSVVSTPADWDATFSVRNYFEKFAKASEEEAAKDLKSRRLIYIL